MEELLALEEVYASETTLDAGSNPAIDILYMFIYGRVGEWLNPAPC